MKIKALITLFVIVLVKPLSGQKTDCIKDFDFLVKKIKADYPGYNDKVTDENRPQLLLLEKEIRAKIAEYSDSCGYYMNVYAEFFKDYHLRINRIRNENNQRPEIMDVSTYGKNLDVNVDNLQKSTMHTDKIEGVWQGFWEKILVVKDGLNYVGVIAEKHGWKNGQVLYQFEPLNDTLFDVINYSLVKDRRTYKTKASLHLDGKILEMHDVTRFIRKSESDLLDQATLYSYVPIYPNGVNTYPMAMYLDDSTFCLRVPGFDDDDVNEAVVQHWDEIMSRPNLIIDIRNNGGGQDNYYEELAKIIYTKPYESKGVEWYASKGNIKLFEDAIKNDEIKNGEDGLKWTRDLLKAMKKNVGGFVTHPHDLDYNSIARRDTVYPYPRHVGIIINENNASSAEQFLLTAKESDKVILFGNSNTAGILDYSNITPNKLPSGSYQLWCPMTRSKRLPDKPIDNIGIAPDVIIPFPATEQLFDKLDSWTYFVKIYLELLDEH